LEENFEGINKKQEKLMIKFFKKYALDLTIYFLIPVIKITMVDGATI
jgi:hypothetical protein